MYLCTCYNPLVALTKADILYPTFVALHQRVKLNVTIVPMQEGREEALLTSIYAAKEELMTSYWSEVTTK